MYSKALSLILARGTCQPTEVLHFLEKRKLLTLLPQILRELQLLEQKERERTMLIIETPFTLSQDATQKVKELVGANKEVETKIVLKKNLLSGFKALYDGQSYDASARRIISQLTTQ